MLYFAHCTFDPAKGELRESLKRDHVGHILKERANLVFGGVIGNYEALCLYVRAETLAEARALIERDPYRPAYQQVVVTEFQQRLPEPQPDFFEKLYQQLSAVAGSGMNQAPEQKP